MGANRPWIGALVATYLALVSPGCGPANDRASSAERAAVREVEAVAGASGMPVVNRGSAGCASPSETDVPSAWTEFRTPSHQGSRLIIEIMKGRGWRVDEAREVTSGGYQVRLIEPPLGLPDDSSAIVFTTRDAMSVELTVYTSSDQRLCPR